MSSPNKADRWYYAHDSERLGPFTGQQLHDLAVAGQILLVDMVWKEGIAQGVAARNVKYLFTAVEVAAPSANEPVAPTQACPPPVTADLKTLATPDSSEPRVDSPSPAAAAVDLPLDGSDQQTVLAPAETATDTPPKPAEPAPATASTARLAPKPAKKGRAVAGKGITITAQDGKLVKFKKKCTECGHEDSSSGTVKFAVGNMRVAFFCPKCKKQRHGEIRGYAH